eukprot:GHVT01032317.1.p2 GENE.GHVT01032317.1~~GHVT01032317.1.p2  ORF type:complete len:129 (+),score=38.86 GHVT01032317.1:1908-2294(+)
MLANCEEQRGQIRRRIKEEQGEGKEEEEEKGEGKQGEEEQEEEKKEKEEQEEEKEEEEEEQNKRKDAPKSSAFVVYFTLDILRRLARASDVTRILSIAMKMIKHSSGRKQTHYFGSSGAHCTTRTVGG